MTETNNRFTVDYDDESIIDRFAHRYIPTDDIYGVEDICDLLNELHEENSKLREYIDYLEECHQRNKGLSIKDAEWVD